MGRYSIGPDGDGDTYGDFVWDSTSWAYMSDVGAIEEFNVTPPPPIPEIGAMTLVPLEGTNAVALTWFTGIHIYDYILETRANLVSENWSTNGVYAGIDGDLTITSAVENAQSFYRVSGE